MINTIPKIGENLNPEQIAFLENFTKASRKSIVEMVVNAQSGHPGGSLSSLDYLALIYTFIIGQTGEDVIVSHGHISPAVYSVLAEMGYIPKEEVVKNFRKAESIYEGHITRHVKGIVYGTGPLGIGGSIAYACAQAEKMKDTGKKVFCLMGDGEMQEGQVHEFMENANHYKTDNLILFVDYNKVQLTDSLEKTMNIDIPKIFDAHRWKVIETNGHNFEEMWDALKQAYETTGQPIVIIGNTVMGKGAGFMEEPGKILKPDWHGKAPKKDAEGLNELLETLNSTEEETKELEHFRKNLVIKNAIKAEIPKSLTKLEEIKTGKRIVYPSSEVIDCRTAYGKALLDLAKLNPKIIALTADLKGSVMTKFVSQELPKQYIETGIAEQHMISSAGGFSIKNYIPFASTFGAFISSRAKDQARVNDINRTNVKMVATHCGLSVGEDGPTHQAIDDMGSFLGMYNTMVIEPACPNQTDAIIRYIASHYGNFYVRMGRHKFPIITKEDGTPFFDENYEYIYGKTDTIKEGKDLTIIATGATVAEALTAYNNLKTTKPELSIEIIAVSSIKKFDENLINSIKKTGKIITVEDHNILSGLGAQISKLITEKTLQVSIMKMLGVKEYQLSGTAKELYEIAKIDSKAIENEALNI